MTTPLRYTLGIILAAGIFGTGYVANRQPGSAVAPASERKVLYYTCPMHPQYKSDHPGDAPCCGMRMVPVHAGEASDAVVGAALPPGAVQVSAGGQQLTGIHTEQVQRAPASHLLRVPGRVAVDEGRLYRLIAAADGWIRELGSNPAGTFVRKGEVLASFYAANLQAAQQTLLFAIGTVDQLQPGEVAMGAQRPQVPLNLQIAIDTLRGMGMNDRQIDEIRQTRKYVRDIRVYSPVTGFILGRSVSPEQRFDKGSELYRIADISHVWIMTDLFEKDREFAGPGAIATIRYKEQEFRARMSDVLPQFDPQSRTLKARFEVDNPGYVLRPDMFVDVELQVDRPPAITIPADAIIDTGLHKTVYVSCGPECFAPRTVETGWRLGERVEVTKGLEPGDTIVVGGAFLLDSESRMRVVSASAVSAPKPAAETDVVCGMSVDPSRRDTLRAVYGGKTYYFCSGQCKKAFEANPERYIGKKASTSTLRAGREPV